MINLRGGDKCRSWLNRDFPACILHDVRGVVADDRYFCKNFKTHAPRLRSIVQFTNYERYFPTNGVGECEGV